MGYPPDRGRLSTRYSPVRHFTRPANRAFSCDLHVLGMPPALILSQDQTLQFYLEFSRTRAHYLVFKEQVLLVNIVSTSPPLSRGLFLLLACPPRAAPVYVTNPRFPVKHLFQLFSSNPRPPLLSVPRWPKLSRQCRFILSARLRRPPLTKTFPGCRTLSGLAARLQVSDPNQWPGNPSLPASMLNQ